MNNYLKSSISKLYGDDDDFIVLGLTGQTGSGCSTVADILKKEHYEISHSLFSGDNPENNDKRKDKLVAKDFDQSWEPFCVIHAGSVLTLLLTECGVGDAMQYVQHFLSGDEDKNQDKKITNLKSQLEKIASEKNKTKEFYCKYLPQIHNEIRKSLEAVIYTELYQQLGKNLRESGNPIKEKSVGGEFHFFALAEKINSIIKDITAENKRSLKKTHIVVDAIRSPLEAMFFQERYAAFFLVAVLCSDEDRRIRLHRKGYNEEDIKKLDEQEYKGRNINDESSFAIQDIQTCLQKADLYIHNANEELEKLASQVLKFISLMKRPGLVSPTAIERCMQIAYTAKLNSGCISRQVGAVITDENFSIKAIGWNDTPHGQVPCNLRNRFDLITKKDQMAYSTFEKDDNNYRDWFTEETKKYSGIDNRRNVSYCFKSEYNKFKNKEANGNCKCNDNNNRCMDNQVHTRSLHAEENAFLQISKYGGQGLEGCILFTTASPCELCAKKAYQLGIKTIYYIDPYPGIATSHILNGGTNNPELILFSGAIGRAFHRLYSPIVPYKDELNALIGNS